MAFCASCGSQVEGRFCAKCGATVGAAAPAPPPPPQAAYQPPPPPQGGYAPPPPQGGYAPPPPQGGYYPPPAQPAAGAPMADNVASALCYVLGFITGIIFLVMEPYNRNRAVRFHAFQSIFLSVACIIVSIVLGMIAGALMFSGGLSTIALIGTLFLLIRLAMFVLFLVVIVFAYQGKPMVLPIIGPLAQKQANS